MRISPTTGTIEVDGLSQAEAAAVLAAGAVLELTTTQNKGPLLALLSTPERLECLEPKNAWTLWAATLVVTPERAGDLLGAFGRGTREDVMGRVATVLEHPDTWKRLDLVDRVITTAHQHEFGEDALHTSMRRLVAQFLDPDRQSEWALGGIDHLMTAHGQTQWRVDSAQPQSANLVAHLLHGMAWEITGVRSEATIEHVRRQGKRLLDLLLGHGVEMEEPVVADGPQHSTWVSALHFACGQYERLILPGWRVGIELLLEAGADLEKVLDAHPAPGHRARSVIDQHPRGLRRRLRDVAGAGHTPHKPSRI